MTPIFANNGNNDIDSCLANITYSFPMVPISGNPTEHRFYDVVLPSDTLFNENFTSYCMR